MGMRRDQPLIWGSGELLSTPLSLPGATDDSEGEF
jgi:hypothetical protein